MKYSEQKIVAEWDLEQRAFAAANSDDLTQSTRDLIKDLWKQYCLAASTSAPVKEQEAVGWPLREMIACAMLFRSAGDPYAKDVNGKPRWMWYAEEADKFIELFSYRLPALASPVATREDVIRECISVVDAMKKTHSGMDDAVRALSTPLEGGR